MDRDVAALGSILSIWAHPDDETYLAGGLMAVARRQGQPVTCVSATAGEHGTDDPVAWPPERLGRRRRWEAAAAMAVLGVDDHRWLGFEDGRLAATDGDEGIGRVAAVIDDVAPDTILTFGPDGMTFHPDHIAISAWVTEAWRRDPDGRRLLYAVPEAGHLDRFRDRLEEWGVYMSDDRPVPRPRADLAVHLELEDELLDQKLAALAAMHSQVGPAMAVLPPADFRAFNGVESFVPA